MLFRLLPVGRLRFGCSVTGGEKIAFTELDRVGAILSWSVLTEFQKGANFLWNLCSATVLVDMAEPSIPTNIPEVEAVSPPYRQQTSTSHESCKRQNNDTYLHIHSSSCLYICPTPQRSSHKLKQRCPAYKVLLKPGLLPVTCLDG